MNKPVFLEILEVSYPATTKNVGVDDCSFILQINYKNLKKNESDVYEQNDFHFLSKNFTVPEGIYDLEKLINFLNMLEEYDMFISKDNNEKIKISVNMYIEYWLNPKSSTTGKAHDGGVLNKFRLSSKSCENLQKKLKIDITLHLSKKLAFILGFKLQVLHFQQQVDGEQLISTAQLILSDYFPDVK